MILVDSSVWADFFNGFDSPEKIQLSKLLIEGTSIFITPIVISEVLAGIRDERSFKKIRDILTDLPFLAPSIDDHIFAAEYYRNLRSHGITVRGIIDCLIAVLAIKNNLTLLCKDRDFKHIRRIYPKLNILEV